jgi:hypothetical protein
MAIGKTALIGDTPYPAFRKYIPERVEAKTLASSAGAEVLKGLTPMAFDSSAGFWVAWTHGGSNGTDVIRGFLDPYSTKEHEGQAGFQLSASDELIANIITEGMFPYSAISLPAGETSGNLEAALRDPAKRGDLLRINGLAKVH